MPFSSLLPSAKRSPRNSLQRRVDLKAGETGPFVLVGASRGGLLVRAYAQDHPEDVAGFVFVDPSTEDRLFTMIDGQALSIAEVTAEQLRTAFPRQTVAVPRRRPQTGTPFDRLPAPLYQLHTLLHTL